RLAQLAAESLVLLELGAVPLDRLAQPIGRAPALRQLAARAAEQAASERAPRDHAEPVRPARGDDLELDRARGEVVEALLGDQPERVPGRGRAARLRNVPAGEVAAPRVDHLALRDQHLE